MLARKPNTKHVLTSALLVYISLSLPLALLFAVNWVFRYHFFNLAAHYRSKIVHPSTLHAGDSITAGAGHWSLLLESPVFSSITLAENGYTIRQITSKIADAKQYRPKTISIMAGTNDVFHPRYRMQDALDDFKEMLVTAENVAERCIITLPTKTSNISQAKVIAELNQNLISLIKESKCYLIDLNPILAPSGTLLQKYTNDGVHFNNKAYKVWGNELKSILAKAKKTQNNLNHSAKRPDSQGN